MLSLGVDVIDLASANFLKAGVHPGILSGNDPKVAQDGVSWKDEAFIMRSLTHPISPFFQPKAGIWLLNKFLDDWPAKSSWFLKEKLPETEILTPMSDYKYL